MVPLIDWPDEQGGGGSGGYPDVSQVRAGVVFGASGEFTGTYRCVPLMSGSLQKYTFEDFINSLDAYMKANLNTYIDLMNASRTDIVLAKPAAAAYYFQTVIDTEIPYSTFLYYGEVNNETLGNGPAHRERFKLMIAIIIGNSNEAQGIVGKRLLRYRECLKSMLQDGWNSMDARVNMEVTGISPFPFSVTNQDLTHVGIGVNLTMEIP